MPELTQAADPMQSAPSRSWVPSRKAMASGIAGVLTFFVMAAIRHFTGIDLPASVEAMITGGVMWAINYLVPPSAKDVVDHLNNAIVKLAVEDPASPVTVAATK
jgi:Na+/citrate or Na+/malate symporter